MASTPKPFHIHVSDEDLSDLRHRLARTRWPDTAVENRNWQYGAPTDYIKELAEFWHDCDWRKQEDFLNGGFGCDARHFTVQLTGGANGEDNPGEGLIVHYVHVRSTNGNGVPLLLLHGWPGSWFEFHKLFAPLSKAGFDIVAPSLPGYGFSEPPKTAGFGPVAMARTMNALMHQLNYSAYVAQGGDWGSMICKALGQLVAVGAISGPKAIHTNMINATPPPSKALKEEAQNYSKFDLEGLQRGAQYNEVDSGYSKIQGTKPQTIGVALNDSPSGLLAWIVEKLRTWSDCNGNVENSFSKMEMITNVAMYWYGNAATSSARLYFEGPFGKGEARVSEESAKVLKAVVTLPFGFALFPKEIAWVPKSWVDRCYTDVRRFQRMPRGGHFAAWEVPELLGKEIEEFFLKDVDARALCAVSTSSARL